MKLMHTLMSVGLVYTLVTFATPSPMASESIEFDGLIEPYRVVQVGSAVPGVIDSVTVDRGDMVKKDQVLATLQSGVEKATEALARAKAEMEATIKAKQEALEFAERKLERNKDLYSQKALPDQQWDEVETQRLLAQHELTEAFDNKLLAQLELKRAIEVVERMNIRSPLNGVVVERFLHPGEYVEDQPILKLAQIHPLNVEVILPVEMLGSVKAGMDATVKPEAPISGFYTAKVKIVDKVVDAASGTFGVRLELPNPRYQLPPGLKCKVVFLKPEKQVSKAQESGSRPGSSATGSQNEMSRESDQVEKQTALAGAKPTGQASKQYHEVQSGESLYLIATKYGLSVDELCRLNNIHPRQIIRPGQKLLLTSD
ncbi:MAG: efflux RND transporter periplasmic adaptor subunit [Desulfobacteraceae bacterium]